MTTLIFVALGRGGQGDGYTASFPDLPGVAAAGAGMAELLADAREQVRRELKRLTDEGLEWPAATPFERAPAEAGAIPLLVDVVVEDTALRVNISIGERLLRRIDHAAEMRGMSRSAFIALAARVALGEGSGIGPADFDVVAKKLQDEWTELGRKITDSLGPESAFARNMAEFDKRLTDIVRKAADNVSGAMARRQQADGRPPAEAAADAANGKPVG